MIKVQFYILAIFFICNQNKSLAQWNNLQTNNANFLYGEYFLNNDTGFVFGANSTLLKTINGGGLWTNPAITGSFVSTCMIFTNPLIGYVCGFGTIYKTSDGGNSWLKQNSPTNQLLYSIDFVDSLNGIIVGDYAKILKTTHNIAGVCLPEPHAGYVIGNIVTGNWSQYGPQPSGIIQRCLRQMQFYGSGIFKGEAEPFPPTPEVNFNALQAVTYWPIMYLVMPVVILSGLVFLYPQFAPATLFGLDGLLPVARVHYLVAAVILLFMVSHIYPGTMGPKVSSLFKMMFTGWYEH